MKQLANQIITSFKASSQLAQNWPHSYSCQFDQLDIHSAFDGSQADQNRLIKIQGTGSFNIAYDKHTTQLDQLVFEAVASGISLICPYLEPEQIGYAGIIKLNSISFESSELKNTMSINFSIDCYAFQGKADDPSIANIEVAP